MLPVTVQFIVAMLAYALNEQMARRVEYLQEEVRASRSSSPPRAAPPASTSLPTSDDGSRSRARP